MIGRADTRSSRSSRLACRRLPVAISTPTASSAMRTIVSSSKAVRTAPRPPVRCAALLPQEPSSFRSDDDAETLGLNPSGRVRRFKFGNYPASTNDGVSLTFVATRIVSMSPAEIGKPSPAKAVNRAEAGLHEPIAQLDVAEHPPEKPTAPHLAVTDDGPVADRPTASNGVDGLGWLHLWSSTADTFCWDRAREIRCYQNQRTRGGECGREGERGWIGWRVQRAATGGKAARRDCATAGFGRAEGTDIGQPPAYEWAAGYGVAWPHRASRRRRTNSLSLRCHRVCCPTLTGCWKSLLTRVGVGSVWNRSSRCTMIAARSTSA